MCTWPEVGRPQRCLNGPCVKDYNQDLVCNHLTTAQGSSLTSLAALWKSGLSMLLG